MTVLSRIAPLAALICLSPLTHAATFEDWYSQLLSVGGTIQSGGQVAIFDNSQRWVINNWKPDCNANLAGPNSCYAPGGGKLNVHAEKGLGSQIVGDGFLLASLNKIQFANGIFMEASVTPWCYQAPGAPATSCGLNIGIYENEQNYRAVGFRAGPGGSMFFNVWGPALEANFNGSAPLYNSMPVPAGGTYKLKIQYWNSSSGWRWDYFVNGTWMAGHPANPDNAYNMGAGYFPTRSVRLELAAFGYDSRPTNWAGAYNAAEGSFGTVTYSTF